MPFLKFSRDKRGYEHFSLVQPSSHAGKSRPRVLYWFRTPPNVKVGREPFDDEMRRAIEAQNPGVTFDWAKLVATPIPPDVEHWRERRRAEKAARQLGRTDAEGEAEVEPEGEPGSEGEAAPETPTVAVADTAETGSGVVSNTRPHKRRRRRRRRGPQPGAPTIPTTPEPPPDEPGSDV